MPVTTTSETIPAQITQRRNDLHWKIWDGADGFIRWSGYDDNFWWTNIAESDEWQTRVGLESGRIYRLNPHTDTVTIEPGRGEA